jgi:hypothetical protein
MEGPAAVVDTPPRLVAPLQLLPRPQPSSRLLAAQGRVLAVHAVRLRGMQLRLQRCAINRLAEWLTV